MDDSIVKGAERISPLEVLRTRAELSDELHFSGFCRSRSAKGRLEPLARVEAG